MPLISRRAALAGAAVLAAPALSVRAQAAPIRIGFPTPLTDAFGAEAQFNEGGGLDVRRSCWCATTGSTPARPRPAHWS